MEITEIFWASLDTLRFCGFMASLKMALKALTSRRKAANDDNLMGEYTKEGWAESPT